MQFVVRPARAAEFASVIDWAAAEGWNPGLGDLEAFHATDPAGFLIGWLDGVPVSSISVVRYGAHFGFLGFYIVHPGFRGRGFGIATWNAGLAHLRGRIVGLDGVVDQQENYRKSGFRLAGRNIRFSGLRPDVLGATGAPRTAVLREADLAGVSQIDRRVFPAPRARFLRRWLIGGSEVQRVSRVAVRDGDLVGYACIRKCRAGYKIGPLVATDRAVAQVLFEDLCTQVSPADEVILDVPEASRAAIAMATQYAMKPVFETARMYLGRAPALATEQIFGLSTFELG
ncbi:MAG: GNAT family N-acetyltransferase [Paracoccaceae bacterium]